MIEKKQNSPKTETESPAVTDKHHTSSSSEKAQQQTGAEYIPRFSQRWLHPRYWPSWMAVALLALLAYMPARWRDPLLARVGRLATRFGKRARRRAHINLYYCFPQLTTAQRNSIIERMFATALQSIVMMAELGLRGRENINQRVSWHGDALLQTLRTGQQNVIFLVPHGWAVDIPAMLLAASGQNMCAMFHHQGNPVLDYVWNRARRHFGGRLHPRKDGIKPFISSVRQGYWGYYLPDEDHGAEHSYFVDFFATYKATLPAIGRLMKLCRARVIPMFPVYDSARHHLDIYLYPPMDELATLDEQAIARRMNEKVEQIIGPHLEQYTWLLKLLRTRQHGEIEPYEREDLPL